MKPLIAVPVLLAFFHRAWSRKSLTPLGIITALLTGIAHAVHPWSAPLVLLVVFYLGGTKATKVKHDIKAQLTLSATGSHGGEGQRTHVQVLANSVVATVLILLHTWSLSKATDQDASYCYSNGQNAGDLFVVGFVANYAATAADTFSSELGILSKSKPRLITSLSLRTVPPGTNGGVTSTGLLAGLLGAFTIALTSAILLPFCAQDSPGTIGVLTDRANWILAVTLWGGLGSVMDSVLGGLLQASVVDKRTGKIIEGTGGQKVLIHSSSSPPTSEGKAQLRKTEAAGTSSEKASGSKQESRRVESGWNLLDNNGVNVLMAFLMSVGAMAAASWIWNVSIWEVELVREWVAF